MTVFVLDVVLKLLGQCQQHGLDPARTPIKIVLPKNGGLPDGKPDFTVLASCNEVGAIQIEDGEVLIERVM